MRKNGEYMWLTDVGIPILIELSKSVVLLLSISFLYGLTNFSADTSTRNKLFTGISTGFVAILIMMSPWVVRPGLIFDARSVLFAATGAFFGFVPTVIAASIGLIYRINLGGAGVYAGALTIISTSTLGVLWPKIRKLINTKNYILEYYILGLIAHIITLICFLAIPWPDAFDTIRNTFIPYLGVFPIITMILGITLNNQKERITANQLVKNQQALLQASIDSPKSMEIFALDTKYRYIAFNDFHHINMKEFYDVDVEMNHSYLDLIEDTSMRFRIQNLIDNALSGESISRVIEVETTKGKYLEELYSPIRNQLGDVIGVTIISQDITERKKYEESILYLSYRDPLTGLYNRRFYQEELVKLDHPKYLPLSIVLIDINGLKITNDAFGHDSGDQLLIQVSDELRHSFNTSRIARIGGDEFVVILPNTSYEDSQKLIENAIKNIEKIIIQGMHASVAFGLATKIDDTFLDKIIKIAEDDMYSHKLFEVSSHRNETIKTILSTLHEKNPREELHSKRVSEICTAIGDMLGMKANDISLLKAISNLHDIGKIAIDDAVLNKPGKLTQEEWEQIKRHPEIGYRILSSTPEYAEIAQDILCHHERYDGNGYPRGLKGDEIPIRARIISLADAYDAMISDRPYRKALTHEEAIEEIIRCSGTQFDPKIVDIFVSKYKVKTKITKKVSVKS
ncbi:MAG: diguanylate cyclase [Bacillota bacterium]|nr:MAG: diguanylate cyclase [Bacillota bacterium]